MTTHPAAPGGEPIWRPGPAVSEDGTTTRTTWAQLPRQVAALARWLRETGVRRGDRVVGYPPNTTPALIAFLATASIGATWSACAQDYGAHGGGARFAQGSSIQGATATSWSSAFKQHQVARPRTEPRRYAVAV